MTGKRKEIQTAKLEAWEVEFYKARDWHEKHRREFGPSCDNDHYHHEQELMAYAAHCREAEQREDASDYFDLLRRAEAAEASLRSAKELLEFAHNKAYILFHTNNAVSRQCRVDAEKLFKALDEYLSVPSASTAKEE